MTENLHSFVNPVIHLELLFTFLESLQLRRSYGDNFLKKKKTRVFLVLYVDGYCQPLNTFFPNLFVQVHKFKHSIYDDRYTL